MGCGAGGTGEVSRRNRPVTDLQNTPITYDIPALVLVHIAESIRRQVSDLPMRLALADDIALILSQEDAVAFVDMVGAE